MNRKYFKHRQAFNKASSGLWKMLYLPVLVPGGTTSATLPADSMWYHLHTWLYHLLSSAWHSMCHTTLVPSTMFTTLVSTTFSTNLMKSCSGHDESLSALQIVSLHENLGELSFTYKCNQKE